MILRELFWIQLVCYVLGTYCRFNARTNDHDWKITYYFPALGSSKFDFIHTCVGNYLFGDISWRHGVKQWLNCWADGVPMITQYPIQPNHNFTYRLNITGQEGTLWWHAHVPGFRATVHGAFIIRPRHGASSYPFPKPDKEIPVIIGLWILWHYIDNRYRNVERNKICYELSYFQFFMFEQLASNLAEGWAWTVVVVVLVMAGDWWNMDLALLEKHFEKEIVDDLPVGATINGKLGDLYNCSGN